MKISNIKINLVDYDKTKAYVTATVDNSIVLTGMKVIEGSKGLFVAMPSKQGSDGEYYDIFFPNSKEKRQELSDIILEAFLDEKGEDDFKSVEDDDVPFF